MIYLSRQYSANIIDLIECKQICIKKCFGMWNVLVDRKALVTLIIDAS